MFFRNTIKRRGKYTFIIYKRMETGGEMREEEAEKGCSGQKKRGCRQEKEMEGRGKYSYRIKMQAVRKARKDAHTGKKAHFSTGQAERREIKETKTEGKRRKKARMQKKQRREKSSGALKDKCRKTTIFFLMTFFSIAYSSSK